ncbi:MAG: MFS transporter [Planctomycetota bacterium]|jgi:sugar (glycoside-pentoside-hexuronide) transporter|nr:MAG: MFS transporter [Planctomycetota bacterium]
MQTGALSRKTLLCYSAGSIIETSIYAFCGLYLMNFYTDVVFLDPRLVGYAFSIRFIVDACSDPLIGFLSDRTRSRFGRRRPYFLLGAIPAAFFFYLLMIPPSGSELKVFVYLTTISSLLITSLTVFGIPYLALSWELTTNYDDRTRISGYRRLMEIVAEMISTLSVPVMLAVVAAMSTNAHAMTTLEESKYYPAAAVFMGVVAVAAAVITFVGTKESVPVGHEDREGFFRSVHATFQNKPFVILLITFTLVAVADRVTASLLFYLLEHMHGIPKQDSIPPLLAYFFGSLASPKFWIMLSNRIGKKRTYILAMVCWGAVITSFVAVAWSVSAIYLVAGLMGAASSGVLILPGAIEPDVIEWEQVRTGQRREGMYAGVANFSWKISTGLCFLLVGQLLHAIGYDGQVQPTLPVLNGLRLVFVLLPGILLALAILVFRKFPITPQSYSELIKKIEQKESEDNRDR